MKKMKCPICFKRFRKITNTLDICKRCHELYFEIGYKPLFCSDFTPSNFDFKKVSYERKKNLYCGVELEISGDKSSLFLKENLLNDFIYFKCDGSLDYDGIEIVSMPATLNYHLYNWKKIFSSISKFGLNNLDNCGLHFHFNRDYFTPSQIANIDYFINSNVNLITNIGNREPNTYCKIYHKPLSKYGQYYCQDRFSALNLENEKTIELRFFKSTNDYDTFIRHIIDAFTIVLFCSNANVFVNADSENIRTFNVFAKKFRTKLYKKMEREYSNGIYQ